MDKELDKHKILSGHYEEAMIYSKTAVSLSEMINNDEYIAKSTLGLADIYREKGMLEQANQLYEAALNLIKEKFGNDPLLGDGLNSFASLLKGKSFNRSVDNGINFQHFEFAEQGKLKESEKLYLEAISIRSKLLDRERRFLAESYNDIALVYVELKSFDEAENYFQKAIAIDEECLGSNHPEVATDLNNYGKLLMDIGKLQEAEQFITRGMKIRERALGKKHVALGRSFDSMAILYMHKVS